MAIGGKWPHCLSPDGPVAPARFHKWLPCLWINCRWSQQSVQISTYLQLRAAGQRPQREASLQSCFSVTDVNRSCCWLEVISCQSSLQSWPEFGERSELICWPSGWKHNERLTLLKWDSQELSKTPLRCWCLYLDASASPRDPRSKGVMGRCFRSRRGSDGAASTLAFGGTVC